MNSRPSRWHQVWIVLGLAAVLAVAAVPAYAQDDDDDDGGGGGGGGAAGGCVIVDADPGDQRDGFCDNQAIVRLSRQAQVGEFANEYNLTVLASIPARQTYLVRFRPTTKDRAVANELDRDRRTVWAELNYADQAPEGRPRHIYTRTDTQPSAPSTAYAPEKIGVVDAACVTGAGIRVAVVDTGVDATHPAFTGNVEAGRAFFIGARAAPGNSDPATGRMGGHGTHVAGVIDQVAPNARIVPVKALDQDGFGNAFTLAQALDYASPRAQVINLSLGSTFNSLAIRDAVLQASARGDVIVAAAGNSGARTPIEYPASLPQVLSVASTDQNDRRSFFSNFNKFVDLAAPGTEIVSAFPGGQYRTWSGTSMATPWVSGAAALLLDDNVSRNQVGQRLKSTADPVQGAAGGMGAGRLDVGQAVACAP